MSYVNTPRLTARQRQFIKHYMGRDPKLHAHATNSYKAAYQITDTRSAAVSASRLLQRPLIKELIAKATARLDEQTSINCLVGHVVVLLTRKLYF